MVTCQHSQDHGGPFDSADWRFPDQEAREFRSTRHDHRGLSQAHQTTEGLVADTLPPLFPALAQDESKRDAASSYTSDLLEAIEISIANLFSILAPTTTSEAISVVQRVRDQQMDDHLPVIHCLGPTSSWGKADPVIPTPPPKLASIIDTAVAPPAQGDTVSVRDSRMDIPAAIDLSPAAASTGGLATIFTLATEPLLFGTLLHTTQTALSGTCRLAELAECRYCTRR